MSTPSELASALTRVHEIAKSNGGPILRSEQLVRADRELLLRLRWLQEIIKGWYLLTNSQGPVGDSTIWYASFWGFLRIYLKFYLDDFYCLSAESSLDLHTKNSIIPSQVIVIAQTGRGSPQALPFKTSVLIYADPSSVPEERQSMNGLQIMQLPYALCKVPSTYFQKNPKEAEIALRLIQNASELSAVLLKYNFKAAAKRLIGAYRFLGNEQMADNLKNELLDYGWKVKEENPFTKPAPLIFSAHTTSPYVARILTLWSDFRPKVITHFPDNPGLPQNPQDYLEKLQEIYSQDAYNSLSIEGYQVNENLIAKVQKQDWNPDLYSQDNQQRNTLAARGYYEAFLEVKKSVLLLLQNKNSGDVIKVHLKKWFQALFSSGVQAGIIPASDLVGYRKHPVYIRGSRHVPLPRESLIDAMETLFECLKKEESAAVRAILGHYIFVYIHPYMDGNGRIGRFLMNTMFASGGYPWTIIRMKNREQYMQALETAGVEANIEPFVQFVRQEMQES
ncbi:MAG: Fic family protein [Chlamydiales bacterium]|nr:Fic family protein [Chlamydiales bacterium]